MGAEPNCTAALDRLPAARLLQRWCLGIHQNGGFAGPQEGPCFQFPAQRLAGRGQAIKGQPGGTDEEGQAEQGQARREQVSGRGPGVLQAEPVARITRLITLMQASKVPIRAIANWSIAM